MTRSRPNVRPLSLLFVFLAAWALAGCGERPRQSAGAGATKDAGGPPADPAAEAAALDRGPRAAQSLVLSAELAAAGEALFDARSCNGCHEMGSSEAAPDLLGVTGRRTEAWLRRQIVAPEWMAEHDSLTRALVEQYGTPMSDLGVTDEEATALLHYLLREDGGR